MNIIKSINRDGQVADEIPFLASGTSLQGYIDVSYGKLVETLGEPTFIPDSGKTDAEWNIHTPDGIATIYNYMDGKNYEGNEGQATIDITDWHIGGKTNAVVKWVKLALEKANA